MLVLPEISFLHLILPVTLLLVGGWLTPAPSQGQSIPQGEGGWWVMTMTMAGGVGGGPGTWNIYLYFYLSTQHYTAPRSLKSIFNHPINIYLSHRPPKRTYFLGQHIHHLHAFAIPAFKTAGGISLCQRLVSAVFAVIFQPQKSRQYRAPEVILSMGCLVLSNALVMKIPGG